MWPWGHLAFGYVAYSLYRRLARREPPTDRGALAAAFGTQFPDLVDKPLAWWVGVIPNGRSLTHSVITATLIALVVYLVAARAERRSLAVAFAVGYASHLVGDSFGSLLGGTPERLAFLLWPLLPPVRYDDGELLAHLLGIELTPLFAAEFVFLVGALALWYLDGLPGTFGRLRSESERQRTRDSRQ